MFKKLKKTTDKVEKVIEEVAENANEALIDTQSVMKNVQIIIAFGVIGLTLGIVADVVSIAVGVKTLKKRGK